MLFNSYEFILVFWPLAWLGSRLCRRHSHRAALLLLVVASFFFYGWWRPQPDDARWMFLPLLLFSIAFNYLCGRVLKRPGAPKGLLVTGVAVNLGLLGYFKYFGFFTRTVNSLVDTGWEIPDVTLPIAISFFTFQQIAYLVDAYQKRGGHGGLLEYCLFVSFFPQLIAGPIVHHAEVMPQFEKPEAFRFQSRLLATGLMTFAIGLFKKVVIADSLSPTVAGVFDHASQCSFFDAWGGVTAYALQLYFDFSGYADMAVGLGLTFNIRLPENFNSPYQARNIIEFWRRWHMTLSRFLRDYLYYPLGGNRLGVSRRYLNLFVTMGLGGLWHGAAWTFVIWGLLHGGYLAVNHAWRRSGLKMPGPVAWGLTLLAVWVGWVFFRATSLERATDLVQSMVGVHGFAVQAMPYSLDGSDLRTLLIVLGIAMFAPNRRRLMAARLTGSHRYALAFGLIFLIGLLHLANPSPFLYFQF